MLWTYGEKLQMKMKKNRNHLLRTSVVTIFAIVCFSQLFAQKDKQVKIVKASQQNKIDVLIGDKLFTSFLYPDTLEKPVLYPVRAADGTVVTRGFPLNTQLGDPTDHPHHIGMVYL